MIRTKLHRPPVTAEHVYREQLVEQLNKNQYKPLTLVCAPAGYGKSMLISSWLERCKFPYAWVSLSKDDSDLRDFLLCVLISIQKAFPVAMPGFRELIEAPSLPPIHVITEQLINDMDEIEEEYILVLDDYHLIHNQHINEVINRMLQFPPQNMHLVIISRRDPSLDINLLRARSRMNEIRMPDLRFSEIEIKVLFEKLLNIELNADTVSSLYKNTEGWVTGLRLVSLVVDDLSNPDQVLKNIKGDIFHISDYIMSELLSKHPPERFDQFLRSSILRRFCPDLLNQIFSDEPIDDGLNTRGKEFIHYLVRLNLFVIALDNENKWFRYHHLFRKLLINQAKRNFKPDELKAFHCRVSPWFEKEGFIEEAIEHTLKGGSEEVAAEILEKHRYAEQDKDGWRNIERWLHLIPDQIKSNRPGLLLAQVWVLNDRFQMQEILPIIEKLQIASENGELNEIANGELNFFLGMLNYWAGEGELSLKLLIKANDQIPQKHSRMAGLIEIYMAFTLLMVGQVERADHDLRKKIAAGRSLPGALLSRLVLARSFISFLSGNLLEAFNEAEKAETIAEKSNIGYTLSWSRWIMAMTYLNRNDRTRALLAFKALMEHIYSMHNRAALDVMIVIALLYEADQQSGQAFATMEQLQEYARNTGNLQHISVAQSGAAHLALAQGNLEAASQWAQTFHEDASASKMSFWFEIPCITRARILLKTGTKEILTETSENLSKLFHANQSFHNTCQSVHILVLLSALLKKLDRLDEAHTYLKQAIFLGKAGGWIRPFTDVGNDILELLMEIPEEGAEKEYVLNIIDEINSKKQVPTFSSSGQVTVRAIPDPESGPDSLSRREMEVLNQLAKGLRNKEIAEKLYISTDTVKKHLRNSFIKLNVNTRIQAIRAATAVGIIEQD